MGVETIKRQTMAMYCCMDSGQSLWAPAWTAWPIGFTPVLSVTQKRCCSCICGMGRYISVMCLCNVVKLFLWFVVTVRPSGVRYYAVCVYG